VNILEIEYIHLTSSSMTHNHKCHNMVHACNICYAIKIAINLFESVSRACTVNMDAPLLMTIINEF
jgi:hypothetical protein